MAIVCLRQISRRETTRRETTLRNSMFYVYLIKSLNNGDIYIGSCEDLFVRLKRHNGGYVRSTKAYCPWNLLEYEKYKTRSEAARRERFLKTGQQREFIKKKFRHS